MLIRSSFVIVIDQKTGRRYVRPKIATDKGLSETRVALLTNEVSRAMESQWELPSITALAMG